jgi:NAD(P)-dependent dehydrogenase (short-subunit alcohol dehydrogenase family)
MRALITGTSRGIGRSIAKKFLDEGHTVAGIDIADASDWFGGYGGYSHYRADVRLAEMLPEIGGVEVLINNAGCQFGDRRDIDTNLCGLINCTEKYGLQPKIKSIVNIASASASSGSELGWYAASKGGVLAYTKWTALETAKYGATCNSVSPGGVYTESNAYILDDPVKHKAVMDEALLGKWAEREEIAEWVYFIAVTNRSMTAQDVLIDNGEMAKANFIQ